MTDFNYLIDVHSAKEDEASNFESLKEVIKGEYSFFAPYLDDLYFIEANIIYLNYVANVPQVKIAEIFNIKQYGVSKRISSALRRLAIQLKAPDSELDSSHRFLSNLVPSHKAYVLIVWYALKTVSAVASSVRVSNMVVTKVIDEVKELFEELAKAKDVQDFMSIVSKSVELDTIEESFYKRLNQDYSFFLVIKHKLKSHIRYIEELQNYNSRGSHNFRKEWH